MPEDTVVIEPELKLESPNMDEQSAAPKEVVVDAVPDKEKVGSEAKETEKKEPEVAEVVETEERPAEQVDWKDRELKRKHAQIKERDRQLAEQAQKIADLEALANRPADGTEETVKPARQPQLSESEIERRVQLKYEQDKYDQDLVTINDAGIKNYGKEWDTALGNLATMGNVETQTMNAIRATDDPAKVLYELGKNPAEYQRIMELAPARQANEFAKLALKQAPKKTVSAAPEPVETIRTRATPSDAMPPDNATDDEWYAAWNARQEAKRKKSA